MNKPYSIRMRASKEACHISGAERLGEIDRVKALVLEMIDRAFQHERGRPDFISIKIDQVDEKMDRIPAISKFITLENESVQTTVDKLGSILQPLGFSEKLIKDSYDFITSERNLSGAMLIDIHTGKRIDQRKKGIRVSRLDWDLEQKGQFIKRHPTLSQERQLEAIALASKVQHAGALAEICCSDDPQYTTGYVACKQTYYRIPNMKTLGSRAGGRIFFVDPLKLNIEKFITYLEEKTCLIGVESLVKSNKTKL